MANGYDDIAAVVNFLEAQHADLCKEGIHMLPGCRNKCVNMGVASLKNKSAWFSKIDFFCPRPWP